MARWKVCNATGYPELTTTNQCEAHTIERTRERVRGVARMA